MAIEVKALIVGVAGGSASGKSTAVARAGEILEARGTKTTVIKLDQFFDALGQGSPLIELADGSLTPDCNLPDIIDTVKAEAAIAAAASKYRVVIVEGHLLFAFPCLRDLMDVMVFFDAPADVRFIRRLKRDIEGKRLGGDLNLICDYWLKSARPGHLCHIEPTKAFADHIVDGLQEPDALAAELIVIVNTAVDHDR